jgi:hypothetical protein
VYSLHRPMKAAKMESIVLSFSKEYAQGVIMPHDDNFGGDSDSSQPRDPLDTG